MKSLIYNILFVFGVSFIRHDALAFPEMIGQGYQTCVSCHYESGGGGPTNSYGKGIAEEMSTWSREGEGGAFYGFLDVAPLGLHGDFRYLAYRYEDDQVIVKSHFPMQRELSASVDFTDKISALMSCGQYGYGEAARQIECRRYFTSLRAGPLGFRAGRFLPAFGINIPDHTKAIKELFQQGKESMNAEISVRHRLFEVVLTRSYGRGDAGIKGGDRPTVAADDAGDGHVIKASLFILRGLQVGYSAAELTEDGGESYQKSDAFHAYYGTQRIGIHAEHQRPREGVRTAFGSLGVKPIDGLWLKAELDYRRDLDVVTQEIFGTVQFFPRPHFEFLLSGSEKRVMFISHFYL